MESKVQIKEETMGYVKQLKEALPHILSTHNEFKEEVYKDGYINSKTKRSFSYVLARIQKQETNDILLSQINNIFK